MDRLFRLRSLLFATWLCLAGIPAALAAVGCGALTNAYGPYDYRADKNKLKIVEDYHFTPDVEFLRIGTSGTLGADIAYTLRAFPNHPRALRSMDLLGRKLKTESPPGAGLTVECFFERAIRFRKDDAMAKVLYGMYLVARKRNKEGLEQLETAEALGAKGANFHYSMGLVYFDLGRHDSALKHAKLAYDMGFPLPGLKDKLRRAGKWR